MSRVRRVSSGDAAYYEQDTYEEQPFNAQNYSQYPSAIGILKGLAWAWFGLSTLIAVLLILGSATGRASWTGTDQPLTPVAILSEMASTVQGISLVAALFIFAQGLLVWAVLTVLAIIAQTLIDIRDN